MDAFKKFLKQKKADSKFKQLGPGHKLSGDGRGSSNQPKNQKSPPGPGPSTQRSQPSDEQKNAALAALARVEKQKNPDELRTNRQIAFIREQARKQIAAEKALEEEGRNLPEQKTKVEPIVKGNPENMVVSGVYFSCPIIGPEIASKEEILANLRTFLYEQPKEELGMTSCLIIKSCNKGSDKITAGVEIICKYLDNIIQHPEETKYRKIKTSNKIFQEKVASLDGAFLFFEAAGFIKRVEATEEFLVFEPSETAESDSAFISQLLDLKTALMETGPIPLQLDRNLQVLMPSDVGKKKELPQDFYNLTALEVKREQERREKAVELEKTLRTKAQRERDEQRDQRIFRYAVMRVRFPDGLTLQGTFYAREKVGDIYEFVLEKLVSDELEFSLKKPGGEALNNMEMTLAEAHLAPASIVNFKLDSIDKLPSEASLLKQEVLALVQQMG